VDRVLRFAFDLAMTRPRRKLTSATKSNGITFTMPYWDERFAEMAKAYPGVATDQFHIDILCAHFVQHPDWFDVVVGSNLFGDILSDLGPAVAGSIGIAPSANINPEKTHPSMFEPVHGSAPDIAGQVGLQPDRADLVGRDDAGAPGREAAADAILAAIERCWPRAGRAPATWAAMPAPPMSARRWPRRWPAPDAGDRRTTARRGRHHLKLAAFASYKRALR
jgi:tartrate dehydrogenase/decarboxylase/D-malate dehydrogenase